MTIHEVLERWQLREISTTVALKVTGARDEIELHALSLACDIEILSELTPGQRSAVDAARIYTS